MGAAGRALFAPGAFAAPAFEYADDRSGPRLEYPVNQARLRVAFGTPLILAGSIAGKLFAAEEIHFPPCQR
jgi:hypothetical protein